MATSLYKTLTVSGAETQTHLLIQCYLSLGMSDLPTKLAWIAFFLIETKYILASTYYIVAMWCHVYKMVVKLIICSMKIQTLLHVYESSIA